jgi:hypothetical protein
MLEKRFGREFERVREIGSGRPSRARKGVSTARYDFFFDAVNDNGMRKGYAHKWRETNPETAEKKLRSDYRKRGWEITKIYSVAIDPRSVVNPRVGG